MKRKDYEEFIKSLYSEGVSANECTGLLQHVSLDPDEIAKYHEQYVDSENMADDE